MVEESKVSVTVDVTLIRYVKETDIDHDLSWLDQTDEEMGEGFEEHATERKEAFNGGEWFMVGIYAEALTDDGQVVDRSPGLWNIESDSGDDYFDQVAADERSNLAVTLTNDRTAFDHLPTEWRER